MSLKPRVSADAWSFSPCPVGTLSSMSSLPRVSEPSVWSWRKKNSVVRLEKSSEFTLMARPNGYLGLRKRLVPNIGTLHVQRRPLISEYVATESTIA
jgi:hypothetical protein